MSSTATVGSILPSPAMQRAGSPGGSDGTSAEDLQNQFMTMLIAQLKNQDPTNPMDNSQLTSQLAQINTLSGIEKLNGTLASISGQINTSQSMQNTLLIGHGVMVPGDVILAGKTGEEGDDTTTTTPFGLETSASASDVVATIKDKDGNTVATLYPGSMTAGVHSFQWDGTTDDGDPVPAGQYTVSFTATDGDTPVDVTSLCYAVVNGVNPGDYGTTLDLGNYGTTTLDQIRQIL